MKFIALMCSLLFYASSLMAQNHYWVFFNGPSLNKTETVNLSYLNRIASKNLKIIGISKWFNAAYVELKEPNELKKIKKHPFIKSVELSRTYTIRTLNTQADSFKYGLAKNQLNMLGLPKYHTDGNTGKKIVIALFDAGFYKVDSNMAFDSLRSRKGILATRDFCSNNSQVYDDDAHGMYVLSLISGFLQDSLVGSAPDANFLLARTEDAASEKHLEEFNWIRALEWADSMDADIIHSSLGYSLFDTLEGNYTYKDMDGKSTIITRAAEMAYSRGIFITNSAGNEGQKPWRYITAPCDGKNVLCIGALDSFGNHAKFSSYGPSADKRIKPDVMTMGHKVSIIGTNNIMRRGSGTSFSGPIMAGFVACLKQKFPAANNAILLDAIRKSAHLYSTPNDSMGYGIPNIQRADSLIKKKLGLPITLNKPFKIFPNPCYDFLTIDWPFTPETLEIADVLGKKYTIYKEDNSYNVRQLTPGIYSLNFKNFGNIKLIKI